jgi:EAL domain-containing protein (putative c-di-GMP-specific phosphodiesterase class I)
MVPPSRFLPMAEQIGAIIDIGAWVLRNACRDAHRWHTEHATTIGVNIAGRQLTDPTFADTVLSALAEAGLPGSALILEVAESSLVENMTDPGARARLDRLRREGIQIAIDDFGAGGSSLPDIAGLPVDLVKIDSSLSQSRAGLTLSQQNDNWSLVRATLEVVSSLHLSAVAEGVETAEQADTLRRLGCRYGQGYYFSPPVPADRIEGLLRRPAAVQLQ